LAIYLGEEQCRCDIIQLMFPKTVRECSEKLRENEYESQLSSISVSCSRAHTSLKKVMRFTRRFVPRAYGRDRLITSSNVGSVKTLMITAMKQRGYPNLAAKSNVTMRVVPLFPSNLLLLLSIIC